MAIPLLLLVSDIMPKKSVVPYSITLVLMVLGYLAWLFREKSLWQFIGEKFAAIFF
jgi:hypothetical protein